MLGFAIGFALTVSTKPLFAERNGPAIYIDDDRADTISRQT
ncbi:MAG: hypothetical protein AB7K04_07975 [Pseudorhodoplanes sp.]